MNYCNRNINIYHTCEDLCNAFCYENGVLTFTKNYRFLSTEGWYLATPDTGLDPRQRKQPKIWGDMGL